MAEQIIHRTFDELVKGIQSFLDEKKDISYATSWCERAGMDIESYGFDWTTYKRKGYGTIVLIMSKRQRTWGQLISIRAWADK